MKPLKRKTKLGYILLSLFISGAFCIGVNRDLPKGNFLTTQNSSDSTYVIEDINVKYLYDTENYEVQSFLNEPYAVIKGNATTINRLKMTKKKPEFYIDLRDKKPGSYQSKISYKGMEKENVTISIYPVVAEYKLQEQQTVSYTPVFEYQNMKDFDTENYTLSTPTLSESTSAIKIRDTQDVIGRIGKVSLYLDVSNLYRTTTKKYKVNVFDTQGKRMHGVNILTPEVEVTLPVEQKISEQPIIQEVVDSKKTKQLEKELTKLKDELFKQTTDLENAKKELDKGENNLISNEKAQNQLILREKSVQELEDTLTAKDAEMKKWLLKLEKQEENYKKKEKESDKRERELDAKADELKQKEDDILSKDAEEIKEVDASTK